MGDHALLGPSGAKRWMSCPPSARLELEFPDPGSKYAAEGTLAHKMAELILRYNNNEISKKAFTGRMNKIREEELYTREMEEEISDYAGQVWELWNSVRKKCPDAQILFEQRLDYSEYAPEGFGTCDVVMIADDTIHVVDLKFGRGVGVTAEENPQLRLYGLGAYLEHSLLYDIRNIAMHIIQPRLESRTSQEITAEELLAWAENTVRPAAATAYAGEGNFQPGDHCRFCRARATCRARAEENLAMAKYEFEDPALLSDEEIGKVLAQADRLAAWVKDLSEYAYHEALAGRKFDGWKLVEGRSNRKYANELQVAQALNKAGYQDTLIYEKKLLGITAMEQMVGKKKFGELLSDLVVKPEGKPVLVPESDKRPELNTAAQAAADFEEEK